MKKLNIGCGPNKLKGYLNLDHNPNYHPDILWDLESCPYPCSDNYFDKVYASHVLEHVTDFWTTFREVLRITKVGGIIHIRVPHFSEGMGHNDLTHRWEFGWYTFQQILDNYGFKYGVTNFKIVKQKFNYLSVNHPFINLCMGVVLSLIPKGIYEKGLCWIIPRHEIELWLMKT